MRRIIFCALFILLLFLYRLPSSPAPAAAQATSDCGTSTKLKSEGLVSTPVITGNFATGPAGACVVDPRAAFAPYKVPSYDDLKSLYYTQAKSTSSVNKVSPPLVNPNFGQFNSEMQGPPSSDSIFLVNGNLTIDNTNFPSNSSKTAVIFVEGNTDITTNITYGGANYGLVLIVRGNVNIDQTVTQIDAVIISEGIICTADNGSACLDGATVTPRLIINGSLISINQTDQCPPTGSNCPIKFRRNLADNSIVPAEQINHQVKYLVILRNLMSDTLQRWSEIP